MKKVAILGSTGSIGTQSLEILKKQPDKFKVSGLLANTNDELLSQQVKDFSVKNFGLAKQKNFCIDSIIDDADIVIAAVSGMAGFSGVYKAVEKGKTVLLANKETLVAGGELITSLAKKTGSKIIPVDSEHSAVFQCIQANKTSEIKRIILTASGGPFYGKTKAELEKVTPEEALKHPTWSMGKKISIDSATMMNKGLEIIEAFWLFSASNIDYIIHKESIIHSIVEFVDGIQLAQLSPPSMLHPIAYALNYPDRLPLNLPAFDFSKSLSFLPPDEEAFPAPKFARQALKIGTGAPLVLNAVNEAAVALFLDKKISFLDIFSLLENSLNSANFPKVDTLESILYFHEQWYNSVIR